PSARTLFPYTTLFRSHDREEDVARQRGRLADDLVGDPVGGAQEEIGKVDRELIEERGDANPQPAEPRAAGLLHQLHELPLLDGRSEEHTSELQSRFDL